jgi:hypothetical protein
MSTEQLITAGGIVAALIWAELREWLPFIARRAIESAVHHLEPQDRERMREELLAEIAVIPGKISPALFAFSVWAGFARARLAKLLSSRAPDVALRCIDFVVATCLLVAATPAIFVAFLLLTIGLRRKPIRRRRCQGRGRKSFDLLTFDVGGSAEEQASRVVWILRLGALDTLPMLWNVVRGDMSLVGPWPRSVNTKAQLDSQLRPGIAWPHAGFCVAVDGYGQSVGTTLRIYFRVLRRTVAHVLLISR